MGFASAQLTNGGRTVHYQISYDETFSLSDGWVRAAQVMDNCEDDFTLMQSWCSGVEFLFSFPINVQIANTTGGASCSDPNRSRPRASVAPRSLSAIACTWHVRSRTIKRRKEPTMRDGPSQRKLLTAAALSAAMAIAFGRVLRRRDVRTWRALALVLSLLAGAVSVSTQPVSAAAVTLTGSTALVGLGGACSYAEVILFNTGGCSAITPGASASSDVTAFGVTIVDDAAASQIGPNAAVRGGVSGTPVGLTCITIPCGGSAQALVQYQAAVTPVGGLVLSVSTVPVMLTANVDASALGTESWANASVTAFGLGTIQACAGNTSCSSSASNSLAGSVAPSTPISLDILAAGGMIRNNTEFQAAADPVLAVSDMLIPGTDINFRDAFTVIVSPDVTQSLGSPPAPAPVPEPATWILLAAALAALGLARRQHRHQ